MKKMLLLLVLSASIAHAILDYDRAIIQSQKNNWPATQDLLTKLVVEQPNRADALYDLGVASYKNNSFDAALAYFNKVAQRNDASLQLQQQAHFNAGNAHVQLKQLQEAIDAYDRVLAQNPDHAPALHNKEVVKKMLEQQSADDKSQEDKDEKNNEQNKDEDNNKDEKQNKDNKNQDQKNKDQKSDQSNANKPNEKKDSDKSDQKDKGSNQPDQSAGDNQQPSKDSESHEPKANKNDNDGQSKQSAGAKAQADKQNENKKSNGANPEQAKRSEGAEQKLSAGLARVLEDREKKDAQLNKKMTKALVANQGGGKNDYNCW